MKRINQSEQLKRKISKLREEFLYKKQKTKNIEKLINKNIEGNDFMNLWDSNNPDELKEEMNIRLSSLIERWDCTPRGKIKSHRKIVGIIIVLVKKILRKLTKLYSAILLERQNQFNQDLVTFLRRCLLRLQFIENRLIDLERKNIELEKKEEILKEKIRVLTSQLLKEKVKNNDK